MMLKNPVPVILLLFLTAPAPADEPAKRTLAVYLPDYRVKADTEPQLYGTTHLVLFSAKPNDNGSVDFSRITPELLAFGEKAKANGRVKVTFCVGGWGRGKLFANAVSSEASRARFVDDLVAFCEAQDLDGVDIDWEFPRGDQEHADFALFLEGLSGKLRPSGRILTVALGYSRPLPAKCWPFIDQVNLMSYQPWSEEPYEAWLSESIDRFLEAGLPPEKLLLGVGFYAKEKAGERRAVSWKHLVGKDAKERPASGHGYWPVGKEACDLRLRLAKERGLAGVMVWDYGHDSPDPEHSLLRYLAEGLRE